MIDHANLLNHKIEMDSFRLKCRFTDPSNFLMPNEHLSQLIPLDSQMSKYLWDFIIDSEIHQDVPFKRGFFRTVDTIKAIDKSESEIRKWLYQRGLPFQKIVYLSYQPDIAIAVPWKILIKYYSEFYYPMADDLTVFDDSLNWALLFHYEERFFFGSNEKALTL